MTLTPPIQTAVAVKTIHVGDRALTGTQAVDLLVRAPHQVAGWSRHGGVRAEVASSVADAIRQTALADLVTITPHEDDHATVTLADMGLTEIVVIAVVGILSGFAVGYLKGEEDGRQQCADQQAEPVGSSTGSGGSGEDAGDGEGP